jgi:hypothetical protein
MTQGEGNSFTICYQVCRYYRKKVNEIDNNINILRNINYSSFVLFNLIPSTVAYPIFDASRRENAYNHNS